MNPAPGFLHGRGRTRAGGCWYPSAHSTGRPLIARMNALLYAALAVGSLWLAYLAYIYWLGHAAIGRSVAAAREDLPGIDVPEGASLVYFYSEHCPPCRDMTPIVDHLAGERDRVYKVDVTARREIAHLFGVRATPMTFVVREGRIVRALLGAKRRDALVQALDSAGAAT